MRSVCVVEAPLAPPLGADARSTIAFADRSFAERLGWREIVVVGIGRDGRAGGPAATLRADERLRSTDGLSRRISSRAARRRRGGRCWRPPAARALAPLVVADAIAVARRSSRSDATPAPSRRAVAAAPSAGRRRPPARPSSRRRRRRGARSIFRTADLTPLVLPPVRPDGGWRSAPATP